MGRKINPNLLHLHKSYKDGVRGVILEGSSRSAKTWSSIDFLVWLCSAVETSAKILIIKETYNSFKTTLYDDFNRRLPHFGIASPFANRQEVAQFKLFGNTIFLLGGDSESLAHGVGSDYFWINESLDVPIGIHDQLEMRCRKFWWHDYNPKVADHIIYNKICSRADVGFLKTTFLDNPYISEPEKRKILSYEPTHPEDRHIEDPKKRRPHPTNIKEGTADDFMWNVYGLGIRSAPEGLIFQHVTWIKEFPKNLEQVYYGLDFGYTNSPSAFSRIGIQGKNSYAENLFYAPTPSVNELEPALRPYKDQVIWADPSGEDGGRGMISELRRMGYIVMSTNTFPGSIKFGISVLKKFKMHLVDTPPVRNEQSMYRFDVINGIKLDKPVDAANHFWDSIRMPIMSNLS